MSTTTTSDKLTDARSVELVIGGMTCASCAARIEKKLNKLDGVTATVNYSTEKAKVTYAGSVTPDDLITTIEATGYTAALPAPKAGSATGTDADHGDAADKDDEVPSRRQRPVTPAVRGLPGVPVALVPAALAGWNSGRVGPEFEARVGPGRIAGPIFRGAVRRAEGRGPVNFPVFKGGFAAIEAEFVFVLAQDAPPTKLDWTLDEARAWILRFVRWYNTEHRHSGLNFVTPMQRHEREAETVMRQRIKGYELARARHPRRWSREIRNWSLPDSVWLNPVKEAAPATDKAA